MSTRQHGFGLLLAACAATVSCSSPPLPTAEELLLNLSYAILIPETTCDELRADFGVDNLPIVDNPGGIGITYEEYLLDTPWGETIRTWYMPVENERGVVVVSTGNTGPMTCYLFTAQLLTDLGWSVVMYDYQGFGGSSGPPWMASLRPDLEQVVTWTATQTGSEQLTLFGMSLGSIPSVAVAVYWPDKVNGVVLDSPIALGFEIQRFDALIRWASEDLIALLDPWLVSEAIIGNMKQRLLVYSHGLDYVATPEAVQALYDLAGGPKTMVRFDDLEHAHGQFQRTDEYQAALGQFLDTVSTPPSQ